MTYFPPKFDATVDTYNFTDSAFLNFRMALAGARANGTDLGISAYGHSIVAGQGTATPIWSNGWPYRVGMQLSGKLGRPAREGIAWIADTYYKPSQDTRWTLGTGTTAVGASQGIAFNGVIQIASAASGVAAFTPTVNVDTFKVYYTQFAAGGTFSMQVDAGSVTTQNTSGTDDVNVVTISAGSVGAHTLKLGYSAGSTSYIQGVEAYDSTAGPSIRVSRCGVSGLQTASFVGGTGWSGMGAAFNNRYSDSLYMVMLTYNDAFSSISTSTFQTNMTTIVNGARNLTTPADVILVLEHDGGIGSAAWTPYANVLYGICDSLNVGLVDIGKRWPKTVAQMTAAPYSAISSSPHPNSKGYWDIAEAVSSALLRLVSA